MQGINPMGLIDLKTDSLENIALQIVKTLQGIKPMGLSASMSDS